MSICKKFILTNKINKDLSFFTNVREKFLKEPPHSGLLASLSQKCDVGLTAFYNTSKLIAKTGKAHTISEELILLAVKKVLETVLHHSAAFSVMKNVLLNNDTVRQWTDEMAEDAKASSCKLLMSTKFFFILSKHTLKRRIFLENIMSAATDGTPIMNSCHCGFIAFLKKEVPNILSIHCVIHRLGWVVGLRTIVHIWDLSLQG